MALTAAELSLLAEIVNCVTTLIARSGDTHPNSPIGLAACQGLEAKLAIVQAEA